MLNNLFCFSLVAVFLFFGMGESYCRLFRSAVKNKTKNSTQVSFNIYNKRERGNNKIDPKKKSLDTFFFFSCCCYTTSSMGNSQIPNATVTKSMIPDELDGKKLPVPEFEFARLFLSFV
jgi:hypothetical protein